MSRYLGIAMESTFGTPVTPPTTFLDVERIGLHAEREEMLAEGMQPLGPLGHMPGHYKTVGDIVLAPSADNLMAFLKLLVGTPQTTQDATSSRYKHVFNPTAAMNFATMYKSPEFCAGATEHMLQYISTAVVSGRFELSRGGPAKCTFGCFGQKDAKVPAISVGTLSTVRPFFSLDANIYWSTDLTSNEITNVDALSFTFSRPVAEDAYAMNDPFLKCFIPGAPKLEGEMDLLFTDWTAYEKFWGGASGPIAKPANAALGLKLTGDVMTGGTGDYANYSFMMQAPNIMIKAIDDPVELRNKIMQSCSWTAARGTISATTLLARFTLTNMIASI